MIHLKNKSRSFFITSGLWMDDILTNLNELRSFVHRKCDRYFHCDYLQLSLSISWRYDRHSMNWHTDSIMIWSSKPSQRYDRVLLIIIDIEWFIDLLNTLLKIISFGFSNILANRPWPWQHPIHCVSMCVCFCCLDDINFRMEHHPSKLLGLKYM